MKTIVVLIAILLAAICAFAEGTRTWQQTNFEEFEKGTAKGIAIRSNGSLELAPSFKPVSTTPSTYIWSLAADAQGNVYAAAGSPARVYRIAPDGQTSIIFEPKELQVQSLVLDNNGSIYAATSPDGKIYKIEHHGAAEPKRGKNAPALKPDATPALTTRPASESGQGNDANGQSGVDPSWTSSVLFEPKTKYIWDIVMANDGNLYVATGDHGEIFRVDRNGQGALFFKSDEAHIRTLALDPQNNLIAGSDGSGLIYRISPNGEAFVLYSAPKKEITAIAVDSNGNIYAAGVGEKRVGGGVPAPVPGSALAMAGSNSAASQGGPAGSGGAPVPQTMASALSLPAAAGIGGSEVYQIAPDGSPKRLWASRDDVVYTLALDGHGHLLAGTGNKGKVFSIANDEEFTDVLKASATQVTAFTNGPNGALYVSTSNLGKLFLMGASPDAEGSYQSDVFDAQNFSRWGRAEVRGQGNFELWTRSGNVDNPDRNWSNWRQVDLTKQTPMAVPPARFIQWRAVLRPGLRPAHVDSVLVNYLPKNVAPKVDDVNVQVGWRFQATPRSLGENSSTPIGTAPSFDQGPPPKNRDRDSIAVRWGAHDENDDQLFYSLYYRGEGEQNWKLLKKNLTDRFYTFDSGLLPDGAYTVKITASDAPSHSPEEALADEKESNRFEVDTTPPQVQDLNAAIDGDLLHITFRALDGFSDVRRAEYSVDAGEWQYVEPVGQLSDYRLENYDFAVPAPGKAPTAFQPAAVKVAGQPRPGRPKQGAPEDPADPPAVSGEHLIVVRVYDKFDNVGVAKTVIHGR